MCGEKNRYHEELPGKRYGSYLKMNRKQRGITIEQLSEGLCAVSMLSDMENGRKNGGKLLRERLLRRTGVAMDAYENYLNLEDYSEWEIQREILELLEQGNTGQMNETLERYFGQYNLDEKGSEEKDAIKRLRIQFYFGMKGMCLKLKGVEPEKLQGIFQKALYQTMPKITERPMKEFVLSAEEINLFLEYVLCLPFDEALERCREIQKYLKNARMEEDARVLNYPKVVFILSQMLLKQERIDVHRCREVFQLCNSGIHILQKARKAYYFWEILSLKKEALELIRTFYNQSGKRKNTKVFDKMIVSTEEWKNLIGELFERFGLHKEKKSDTFLYWKQDIFYIGDVIRTRRKMLRMTQKELYDGICSRETLQRLERGKKNTQPAILWELCDRLALSPESERTELATANPKARELEKTICYAINDGEIEESFVQIKELKRLIDMSNKINQQWMLCMEGIVKYQLKQIEKEEYRNELKKALKCTIPELTSTTEFSYKAEYYFTNAEMTCIYFLSYLDFPENPQKVYNQMKLVFSIEEEFEKGRKEKEHIRTYELYMGYKACILYEMGEYKLAREYAEKVVKLCLSSGRINMLAGALYIWMCGICKEMEDLDTEETNYNWKKDLRYCISLSQFCEDRMQKGFFESVWSENTEC